MFFIWVLLLIAAIIVFKYLYLLIKRSHLLRKIGKLAKKHSGSIRYCRNPLVSVFRHDGKTDISLCARGKTVDISVITTPFRRVRYHFNMNEKLLELIIERRSVYMGNPRVQRPANALDHVITIRKYKVDLAASVSENQKYVILHPAPISASKADGATFSAICDNDELHSGVKVCGLKWFVENIL